MEKINIIFYLFNYWNEAFSSTSEKWNSCIKSYDERKWDWLINLRSLVKISVRNASGALTTNNPFIESHSKHRCLMPLYDLRPMI